MVEDAISKSETIKEVGLHLGYKVGGSLNTRVKFLAELYELDLPKFDYRLAAQRVGRYNRLSDEEWFSQGTFRSGVHTRKRLVSLGVPDICAVVGCPLNRGFSWLGADITPHVDHINGDKFDNRRDNLQFLCPNCHQQTGTWGNTRRGPSNVEVNVCIDCADEISVGSVRCRTCDSKNKIVTGRASRISWPKDQELLVMVERDGCRGTGKILGVSDNSIKKRLRRQNLL